MLLPANSARGANAAAALDVPAVYVFRVLNWYLSADGQEKCKATHAVQQF